MTYPSNTLVAILKLLGLLFFENVIGCFKGHGHVAVFLKGSKFDTEVKR